MADLNGTVSGGQKITGTVEPQAQKLRGAIRLAGSGGGGVTDVWQNGESVLDGTIGKVTVPTNTSDLTNDSGFITTETDPVFGASAAKNITSTDITTWNGKQDALVSGTNIKTVNNTSLLGSGNIDIQGGGSQNVWLATCPTGTSTATKVVTTTSGDFSLTAGNTVEVNFEFTGDTGVNCSLNVDSTGAVRAIAADYSGSVSNPIWSAGDTIAFVYDGTYFRAINARKASTGAYGKTILNTSTSSSSVTEAATPSAVKAAYDLANGKQDALVSGTNIKTVNSTSLLGSGNVAVQPTLVSGTNIKTVNSTSLLGSGDVAVQPTLVSGTNIKTINGNSLLGSGNIAVQSAITSTTVSITVANWNATTTCTKSVTGVTSSNTVHVSPAPASIDAWKAAGGIYATAQGSGTLTFTAGSTPAADITMLVEIIN